MAGRWLSALRIGLKRWLKAGLGLVSLPLVLVRPPKGPRVLLYHRVNACDFGQLGPVSRELRVQPGAFAWQLAHLARRGFRVVALAEFAAMLRGEVAADPRAVLITFDDGYEDNLLHAAPLLAQAGVPAVLFIASGFLGRSTGEVWPHGDAPGAGRFLTAAQVRLLAAQGIAVGSHTVQHPRMTLHDTPRLDAELLGSRQTLEALTGQPVTSFAYPEGDLDARVEARVRAAGYALAFTTQTGAVGADPHPLRLRRTEVSASDSRLVFALKLAGALDWTRIKDSAPARRMIRAVNDAVLARVAAR